MVIPDSAAYDADRAPGLVRALHDTIADRPRLFRNQPALDYGALVREPRIITAQCEDGYVLGIPYGRHLKVFYEFDGLNLLRQHFGRLVDDLGELARDHTECRLMTLEYDDFPNRHYVDPMIIGARFRDPLPFMLLRCRDVREQDVPDAPDGVQVREAGEVDAALLQGLEERQSGEDALAPPLPDEFFSGARAVFLALRDGAAAGYLRLADAPRRGTIAEEFLVDAAGPEPGGEGGRDVATALLGAAFRHGRESDRRSCTIRVAAEGASAPVFKAFGFRHDGDGFQYLRPADPAAARAAIEEKVVSYVKVGKIFGMFR